jgi:3D (Asp-Asp-Asp) domain-containing protein
MWWAPVSYRDPNTGITHVGWVHRYYLRCGSDWFDGECSQTESGSGRFKITTYFRAKDEATFIKEGRCSKTILAKGLDEEYCYEFLCHFSGVAGQGTGLAVNGRLIGVNENAPKGGWPKGKSSYAPDFFYKNCENATFGYRDAVRGKTGRVLVSDQSAAVDPCMVPLGSLITLHQASGETTYRAEDIGPWVRGFDIDIFRGPYDKKRAWSQEDVLVTWDPPDSTNDR